VSISPSPPLSGFEEGLADIDGVPHYVIPDAGAMTPFLMSIVSDSDHWLFVSSSGGLTAGRRDAANALFPYETDDRLHLAGGITGPVTVMRVATGTAERVWEPFDRCASPGTQRSLAKTAAGDSAIWEEVNEELGLVFGYRWSTSERFGFVRTAHLRNLGTRPARIALVDGLLNVLPFGLEPAAYRTRSNLTNAYKRSEIVDRDPSVALHTLEALIVDRAMPAEALRATVTWSSGPPGAVTTVDERAAAALREGCRAAPVELVTGRPGAHLVTAHSTLSPGESAVWHVVADVAKDHGAVAELRHRLASSPGIAAELEASLREGSAALEAKVAGADGLQRTGDERASTHHAANVLFNSMRGGVFTSGYRLRAPDFARFVAARNRPLATRFGDLLTSLPEEIERSELVAGAAATGDPNLERLATEYLPLSFSRRHGDPSRPWNTFSIRVKDDAGHPVFHYEGNWRDIFQNWEALCHSYPEYLPGVIALFVNASTADGFNPYRITTEGIEWEVPDPEDPWSNIGYWGDHQIAYLLRLLEAADRLTPGAVSALLTRPLFTYADVPYRLVPYDEIVADPRSTIHHDAGAERRIEERVAAIGNDGKLLCDEHGEVVAVTLLEKLVVPALSKLSNYVAGGGIWMNTQRPEWNDANNALVGNGLSMVTLYYLRRYLAWLAETCGGAGETTVPVSAEVAGWLEAVTEILRRHERLASGDVSDLDRKALLDDLGGTFSHYRAGVYRSGLSGSVDVRAAAVVELCEAAQPHLDATIRRNRRPDGLYHSYNLIDFSPDGAAASVRHLDEMLEGQVAVLSSGVLDAAVSADVVDALFASALYRTDQASFMLYPERRLPSFTGKNVIPAATVAGNSLLTAMLAAEDARIVTRDVAGNHHFNADLTNAAALADVLDRLEAEDEWRVLVADHRAAALDVYEAVFRHHGFTGRSGTMYAYEGLGSVYWHMVSKLLVAVQESVVAARDGGASPDVIDRLRAGYYRVRAGLGFNKPAAEYGAFPTDPYSHTPAGAGAQQPGMTGQVKEEILTRPGELGVWVADGELCFDAFLVRRRELLGEAAAWRVIDTAGVTRTITLEPGSAGLTVCQVPVTVAPSDDAPGVTVLLADGTSRHIPGVRLGRELARHVFGRTGAIARIDVRFAEADVTLD
jgi:hypothetical protein